VLLKEVGRVSLDLERLRESTAINLGGDPTVGGCDLPAGQYAMPLDVSNCVNPHLAEDRASFPPGMELQTDRRCWADTCAKAFSLNLEQPCADAGFAARAARVLVALGATVDCWSALWRFRLP